MGDLFLTLFVDVPIISPEGKSTKQVDILPTYLDTTFMRMLFNPPYFPDADVAKNHSSKTVLFTSFAQTPKEMYCSGLLVVWAWPASQNKI